MPVGRHIIEKNLPENEDIYAENYKTARNKRGLTADSSAGGWRNRFTRKAGKFIMGDYAQDTSLVLGF
jgi:hypothetical protein